MKLLLIRPPFAIEKFYFPRFINESLGIESLASFLKSSHNIKIIDAVAEGWNKYWELSECPEIIFQGLNQKNILKKISEYKPDVIGITWLFSTQNDSLKIVLKTIRDYDKGVPIIVGGPHPSANPTQILNEFKDINIIVFGEGEFTLKELLDNNLTNLKNINGIAFRNNKEIIINPARKLIENLDILPIPERNNKFIRNYNRQNIYNTFYYKFNKVFASNLSSLPLLDKFYYKAYSNKHRNKLPAADIITSRGCPNHCTFCAVHNIWGHRWRMRSSEHVLKEIDILVKKFGIKHINIQDDNFNVSKQRTIEICKGIIENKYNISILAAAGAFVPTLDEEVLTWLKKAGLSNLRMSIESGNQEILNNIIKKKINLDQVKNIVNICKKLGIYTEGAFMFGVPGETIKTMKQSLDYAKNVGFNRIVKFIFQPFPNTELYDICVKKNYFTGDYDPKKVYITGNKCYIKTDKFSPEDVLKIVNR